MIRKQILIAIATVTVFAWSAVLVVMGHVTVAAIAAIAPVLGLTVQQIVRAALPRTEPPPAARIEAIGDQEGGAS
ncbi:hypothetical protein [Streptomyces alanosinicus]|uniref:Uncharacterized protein n=1 Tax=Streptomyces alanosinicus TaxID=68171 RepID=A0A918YNQ6_9ACTN|nr:hypothetical protein [Streptomyces alanosinicus]GHE10973.1 hypothetical protein GCM10010339_68920 [Streptomyces alanosinicus]